MRWITSCGPSPLPVSRSVSHSRRAAAGISSAPLDVYYSETGRGGRSRNDLVQPCSPVSSLPGSTGSLAPNILNFREERSGRLDRFRPRRFALSEVSSCPMGDLALMSFLSGKRERQRQLCHRQIGRGHMHLAPLPPAFSAGILCFFSKKTRLRFLKLFTVFVIVICTEVE